ncbi:MAG: hypothetical protein WC843_05310 [Candidatus Gracilibacteria bacterium]|jgi:hypothetical protein
MDKNDLPSSTKNALESLKDKSGSALDSIDKIYSFAVSVILPMLLGLAFLVFGIIMAYAILGPLIKEGKVEISYNKKPATLTADNISTYWVVFVVPALFILAGIVICAFTIKKALS